MSTYLSSQAGCEFEKASTFETIFSEDERKKLRKKYDPREAASICSPSSSCDTNLFFGFFFDGTGNNYIAAEKTKDHSNIARLYDCFPGMSVPGVLPKSTDWKYKPAEHKHFFRVLHTRCRYRIPASQGQRRRKRQGPGWRHRSLGRAPHYLGAGAGDQQCASLLPRFPANPAA